MSGRRSTPLRITTGDDYTHVVTFTDEEGAALDVSTWELRSQIRDRPNSATILATFTVDDADAATGIIQFNLEDLETTELATGVACFDIERNVSGRVDTVMAGRVIIAKDVSR